MNRSVARVAVCISAAMLLAGCARPSAAPPAARIDISPPSAMLLTGASAPGFAADLRMVRSVPSASGEDSVSVAWKVDADGPDNKPPQPIAESADANLIVVGVSATGAVVPLRHGVIESIAGAKKDPQGLTGGWSGGIIVGLPEQTHSIRLTFHLGRTPQIAVTGGSVTVPVSAIPVLRDITGFYPFGFSPTF